MAIANFIPKLWHKGIFKPLLAKQVFAADCNREFEGEIKEAGDTVKILTVAAPTIKTLNTGTNGALVRNGNIDDPEEPDGSMTELVIDQARYFNVAIGDIDRVQALPALFDKQVDLAAEKLALDSDAYVAGFATANGVTQLNGSSPVTLSADNILEQIDKAVQTFRERNVDADLVLTATPRFMTILRKAFIIKDTDNSEHLVRGYIGKYFNVDLKWSNQTLQTKSTAQAATNDVDNCMIRTRRAIAFAEQISKVEAYRPEKKFADAMRALHLYGAKVVFPDEVININVKYA